MPETTLESLHNSFHCLANYSSFGTNSDAVFFKFGDQFYKNLRAWISGVDLTVGNVNTYSHKGICQHDLIISDVRLVCKNDPQSISDYPFQIFSSRKKRRLCEICFRFHAKFIVMEESKLKVPYLFICEKCFPDIKADSLNLYPYIHD